MTPQEFIKKWKDHALTERAAAQEHFIDLCRLVDHPTPAEADPKGEEFTFEKGAAIVGGGDGWADVWKKGFFAWEYKKRRRDLSEAMVQLTRYAAALEHPPLLVVCDTIRFEIQTTWTNLETKRYSFELQDLVYPDTFAKLHAIFHDPERLKPARTRAMITAEAAKKFQTISDALQHRHPDREAVAHFVNQLVFCFFADSVKLLPEGLLKKLLLTAQRRPQKSQDYFAKLFSQMERGGEFDLTEIAWFDGGLFDGRAPLPLQETELGLLYSATSLDWSLIDPTIFGTLFERFLDPDKRAQIGAHYTDPEKIMMIVEPVVLRPLREEWRTLFAEIGKIMAPAREAGLAGRKGQSDHNKKVAAARVKAEDLRDAFIDRLARLRILDPACGSGNFLYLALQGVKDIEYQAINECETLGLGRPVTRVGPEILHGIEINPFAAELARTTIWIGDIQWSIKNAIYSRPEPILRKLEAIEQRDSVLNADGTEAQWPEADFIIGNPPFLGGKYLRSGRKAKFEMVNGVRTLLSAEQPGLGDAYVDRLFATYAGRVDGRSDLVIYWIEKAYGMLITGRAKRIGFVSTKSIAKGANRSVLEKLNNSGNPIFEAWTNESWVIDGAKVRVSIVGAGSVDACEPKTLNGKVVTNINSDLTDGVDFTKAAPLESNRNCAFQGVKLTGPFDIPGVVARSFLLEPKNPNDRPNSDVIRRLLDIDDITGRSRDGWVIDFGLDMQREAACFYEKPFGWVEANVKPFRFDPEQTSSKEPRITEKYWLFQRPRPELRKALSRISRFVVTPETSEHRVFVWSRSDLLIQGSLFAIAREDDSTFGILHSRFHDAWSTRQGNRLGVGNQRRYNISVTFETFPFPEGLTPNIPAKDYAEDPRAKRIAAAAEKLDELRRNWLNPPDLVEIVPEVVPGYPDRILPINVEAAAKLKERTLTNLYNERPQWLDNAHAELDRAVAAAYGWPEDISTDEALEKLLALNLERASK
jgi:type II restriction/modification system DNA methylase subunit YeeA